MRYTTNGLEIPQDGEQGNVWSKGIERNIEKQDELMTKVNGLKSTDLQKPETVIDKANWDVDPDGKGYVQTISVPTGILLDSVSMKFLISSGSRLNQEVYPTVIPLSTTVYKVLVNNDTLDLKVLYV